ncbi:MAG: carbohydrate ABC transporter permease [Armatimonadota bacterium]|nr:carbohydrate ABC transporter permease [Armatimonadota bacterium]
MAEGSRSRPRWASVVVFALVVVLGLTMLTPFVWMVRTSLMDELEVFSYPPRLLPEAPKWRNYPDALTLLPFGRFFLNTAIMAAGMVGLQLVVCSMAAYAFARLRFRGRDTLFTAYLSTMLIPQIVTLIPAYLIVQSLGWIDTYWALILPFAHSVWGTFLLRQFFQSLPPELEEAARLDGASELTILFRIILPLARPALATLAIFAFLSAWQAFLWPLLVTDSMQMRPVEVGIAMFQSLYSRNWPYQMAAAVTVMIPVIALFAVAQRQFMRGIALSGTRG